MLVISLQDVECQFKSLVNLCSGCLNIHLTYIMDPPITCCLMCFLVVCWFVVCWLVGGFLCGWLVWVCLWGFFVCVHWFVCVLVCFCYCWLFSGGGGGVIFSCSEERNLFFSYLTKKVFFNVKQHYCNESDQSDFLTFSGSYYDFSASQRTDI